MGHATGEQPQRFHLLGSMKLFLGLPQRLFRPLLLRDMFFQRFVYIFQLHGLFFQIGHHAVELTRQGADLIVAPHPQVAMVVSGHVLRPTTQADFTVPRASGPPVYGLLRNFQNAGIPGRKPPEPKGPEQPRVRNYGAGWNVIAAFDPDAGEVRIRSYRIDDVVAYADAPGELLHRGEPAPTECLHTDWQGVGERVEPWPPEGDPANASFR